MIFFSPFARTYTVAQMPFEHPDCDLAQLVSVQLYRCNTDILVLIVNWLIPIVRPRYVVGEDDYYRLVWVLKGLFQQGAHKEFFDRTRYPILWNELVHLFWSQHLSSNKPKQVYPYEAVCIVRGWHRRFCCVCACPLVEHFACFDKKASTAAKPRCHDCYLDTSKTVIKERLLADYGITITDMRNAGYHPLREIRVIPFREYFIMADIQEFKQRYPERADKDRYKKKKRKHDVSNFVLK